VIVPSEYYRSLVRDEYGIEESKLHVSPSGGVDLDLFRPAGSKKKGSTGRLCLGFVSRLVVEKGILEFLQLIDELKSSGQPVEAIVVGDGPLRTRVAEVASASGLDYFPSVEQVDLPDLYRRMDLFVFPSTRRAESLGLVGLEAMACGVPVIACRGAGPETYVSDRQTGFLVDPGDVAEMVSVTLEFWALPPARRTAMAEAARETASRFGAVRIRKDLVRILRGAGLGPSWMF